MLTIWLGAKTILDVYRACFNCSTHTYRLSRLSLIFKIKKVISQIKKDRFLKFLKVLVFTKTGIYVTQNIKMNKF